ncbi:MAG: hypothetical protein BGO83_23460 [Devosia sp. 66-14]|nr:MAG: hypothetical protein ABS47_11755 [Devosia sp. SCN 66-27]OJX26803.1 MAG: hypothetical protein BGO83_23460 [Devosia sp. 66-14]
MTAATMVPVVDRKEGIYAPTKQQVSETSIAALAGVLSAFDPETKLTQPALEKLNDVLLFHWYGRISADGRWAIQFNPIADMFLFLQIDPDNSALTSATWMTGKQAVALFSVPEKEGLPFLTLVFGERAMQLHYIVEQYHAGKINLAGLLSARRARVQNYESDVVGAAFSYMNGMRKTVLSPCFVEFERYVGGRDWGKLAEKLEFDAKSFDGGYKVIYASKDGQYFVADAVTGRSVLVFKEAAGKTCDFYPMTTVGII